jgi:uncharacterized membrane protein (UPF0127 family)
MKDQLFKDIQIKFLTLSKKQGCVYEDDYHELCYHITDSALIGKINSWLVSSGLVLKKNKPLRIKKRQAAEQKTTLSLPQYSGESDIFDLYDLLALYHGGQGDPIYALQSRRDPESVYTGELEAVETLLNEIISGEFSESTETDILTAQAWLPLIESLTKKESDEGSSKDVTADSIGDPQGTHSVEEQTDKTAVKPLTDAYKKKTLDKVKHPNVNKLGADKEKKVENEFAENSYTKDELESNSLNIVIDTLRDCEDEFLPSWKKFKDKLVEYKKASLSAKAGTFEGMQRDLLTEIDRMKDQIPNVSSVVRAINNATSINEIVDLWNSLYRGEFEQVEEQVEELKTEPFREYIQLSDEDDEEVAPEILLDWEYSKASLNTPRHASIARAACNDGEFFLHVASTQEDKVRGLEVFSNIEKNEGMLFPFEKAQHVSFHMGSVKFPIDIIFLMNTPIGLKVAKVVHNIQPGSTEKWSCNDVVAVVELTGRTCKSHNISIGDLFEVSREK